MNERTLLASANELRSREQLLANAFIDADATLQWTRPAVLRALVANTPFLATRAATRTSSGAQQERIKLAVQLAQQLVGEKHLQRRA
jgi:hypothetical protein|tara:strand:+ start:2713 stop:2973 length:261 start_codon:yes stop_codon:yes gene_type:complete